MNIKQFIGDSKFFVVAFDRSGSTLPETAVREEQFLKEALKSLAEYTAVIGNFDSDFRLIKIVGSVSELAGLEIPLLAGGTLLQPVVRFAKTLGAEKLIVFTDGFLPDFGSEDIPTLFVLNHADTHRAGLQVIPYGETILLA